MEETKRLLEHCGLISYLEKFKGKWKGWINQTKFSLEIEMIEKF